jgi:hypothetical protein
VVSWWVQHVVRVNGSCETWDNCRSKQMPIGTLGGLDARSPWRWTQLTDTAKYRLQSCMRCHSCWCCPPRDRTPGSLNVINWTPGRRLFSGSYTTWLVSIAWIQPTDLPTDSFVNCFSDWPSSEAISRHRHFQSLFRHHCVYGRRVRRRLHGRVGNSWELRA